MGLVENMMSQDLSILLGPNYVPEGNYNVKLNDIQLNITKDNDHYYMIAIFEIINGRYVGKTIKQIWSFGLKQKNRTIDRINNFLSMSGKVYPVKFVSGDVCSLYEYVKDGLKDIAFVAWYSKNADNRSK